MLETQEFAVGNC